MTFTSTLHGRSRYAPLRNSLVARNILVAQSCAILGLGDGLSVAREFKLLTFLAGFPNAWRVLAQRSSCFLRNLLAWESGIGNSIRGSSACVF